MSNPTYAVRVAWEGNRGAGTADDRAYDRRFRVSIDGKPDLLGSADPCFRGDASLANPEELLIAALSSCHMLTYLALCARDGLRVVGYDDAADGALELATDGGGRLRAVTLRPRVMIAGTPAELARAEALHARAGERCFIARSCAIEIQHAPIMELA